MKNEKKTRDAVALLHRRYVGDDPERKAAVEAERLNAHVAQLIHDLRNDAGLTQAQLADLVHTTQSVISRLESDDYEGHSLTMLDRIARALNQRVALTMKPNDTSADTVRFAFRELVRMLRRRNGLTVKQLAKKLDLDADEVLAMERSEVYRPSPLALHQLSAFFNIPPRRLAALAGAVSNETVTTEASRFAAHSDSLSKLSGDEQRILDDFVRALRSEG